MAVCHYAFSKPKECTTPIVKPKIDYRHGAIMVCNFILGKIYTIPENDADNGTCAPVCVHQG